MRRPDRSLPGLVFIAFVLVGTAACSRFSFVRPDASRGDYTQIAHEVAISPEGARKSDAFLLVQAAQARLAQRDAEGARRAAERALALDPSSAMAHSILATSLDALGRGRESGRHHRAAVERAPGAGSLLNNYGVWLCTNGQPADALAWFERAAATKGYASPDAALANAGVCALRAGQGARAEALLRRAIELEPRNPVALAALARHELQSGRPLQARAFIQRRLSAAPADAGSLQLASQIEQQLGDMAAAERYVQQLRAEFPQASDSAQQGGN